MKYPEFSRYDKIPFYFQYFKRKLKKGISKITAQEISEELNIKYPSGTVATELRMFVGSMGYKKYGYNIVALCNAFSKTMNLQEPIHVALIGEPMTFINMSELENVNILLHYESIDSDLSEYSILILSQKVGTGFVSRIPDTVKAVYDFCDNDLSMYDGLVYQFDIASALLQLWFSHIDKTQKEPQK